MVSTWRRPDSTSACVVYSVAAIARLVTHGVTIYASCMTSQPQLVESLKKMSTLFGQAHAQLQARVSTRDSATGPVTESLLSRIYSGLQVGMGSSASCLVLPVPCWLACWRYWRSQGQAGSSRQQPNMELLVPMSAGWTTSSTASVSYMATIVGGHSGHTSSVASRREGLQGMAKQSQV